VPDPTAVEIARAADVLRRGELVAFPTETVYGLGADASSPRALQRLYLVKQRPPHHPVIVHVGDASTLDALAATVSSDAEKLVAAFWPGPLTIVVPRSARVPDEVTGGGASVGVRVPDQPVALALLREFGGGIAAPSANRFGRVSPTTAEHVRADLGHDVACILDGGPCRVGVESTIVDCSDDEVVVLRLGGIAREEIERVLGRAVDVRNDGTTAAPGTLPSHYAPRARVELVDARDVAVCASAAIERGARVGVLAPTVPTGLPREAVVIGVPRTTDEYARSLYEMLRAADAARLDVLLAVAPCDGGLGAAVADRLRRAAGKRES
jgi:L-threonylcarbamoyladenylate synthase